MNQLEQQISIQVANLRDYSLLQSMARFYTYELSRYDNSSLLDWTSPADDSDEFNFKTYLEDPTCSTYLIKVNTELAGFVLLNKKGLERATDWNIGEFFILAKFQSKGIGRFVAEKLWSLYPGKWEIAIAPENTAALAFWRKTILIFTCGHYHEGLIGIDQAQQNRRYLFKFDTQQFEDEGKENELLSIQFVDELSPELDEQLNKGCLSYANALEIDVNYKRFSILLSNKHGAVCGILKAYTLFSEVIIDSIWVDGSYRGNGYGRKLLTVLEERFTGKGFNNISVITSAFQATTFYQKCGYILEYIGKNEINPQLSKILFVKFFKSKN